MTSEAGRAPVRSSPKAMKKFGASRNQNGINIYPVKNRTNRKSEVKL
jgi:hypothetical protein